MNSGLWRQLSIRVVIISQYDIYVKDAVFHTLLTSILHFEIQSIFVGSLQKAHNFRRYFPATQRTLIGSHSGKLEVKEHAKPHLFHIYHIVIQSKLKYLIGAKVQSCQNRGTCQKTAGSDWFGLLMA